MIYFLYIWSSSHTQHPVTTVPDLSGSIRLDEVLVYLLGLGSHLHRALGLLEVLAGHPKLNVLLTELRLQEASEGSQTIWERDAQIKRDIKYKDIRLEQDIKYSAHIKYRPGSYVWSPDMYEGERVFVVLCRWWWEVSIESESQSRW